MGPMEGKGWMPMSDFCPDRISGFTLLELIVAIVIMALVLGMALPNMSGLLSSVQRSGDLKAFKQDLNALGVVAQQHGRTIYLSSESGTLLGGEAYLELPQGLSVYIPEQITYRSNGACLGGEIELLQNGESLETLNLAPPHCQIHVD